MASLIRYEGRHQPLAPRGMFLRRLGRNVAVALAVIVVSLAIGMVGITLSNSSTGSMPLTRRR